MIAPIGSMFGSWEVLGDALPDPSSREARWRVRCTECGGTCVRRAQPLKSGASQRCGGCRKRRWVQTRRGWKGRKGAQKGGAA